MDYRQVAYQAAQRHGLDPNVFVRQIQHESNFNPHARSPVGAIGIAQIMPATAKGWRVNPHDPVAALDAAAKNMAGYVRTYKGNYSNALAAYNAGPGAVAKYHGVPPYRETQAYVKNILRGTSQHPQQTQPQQTAHNTKIHKNGASAGAQLGELIPEHQFTQSLIDGQINQPHAPSSLGNIVGQQLGNPKPTQPEQPYAAPDVYRDPIHSLSQLAPQQQQPQQDHTPYGLHPQNQPQFQQPQQQNSQQLALSPFGSPEQYTQSLIDGQIIPPQQQQDPNQLAQALFEETLKKQTPPTPTPISLHSYGSQSRIS